MGGPPPPGFHHRPPPPHGFLGPPSGALGEPPGSPGRPLGAQAPGYSVPPPAHPDYHYDGARRDPYESPFSAVPPPPGLDASSRGGHWKGRGRAWGPHDYGGDNERSGPADGLMVSNLPTDLATLSVLNRHFRQFGEVLKITVQAEEGKAFVQFADASAVQGALLAPVLERQDIVLARVPRGKGRSGVKGRGKGDARLIENRVLHGNPDEQRRQGQQKLIRDEITSRKTQLLGGLTDQLKVIMAKLNGDGVTEAKKDALKAMLTSIKAKMDAIGSLSTWPTEKADDGGAAGDQGSTPKKNKSASGLWKYTLDLRPRVVCVGIVDGWTQERLREELQKFEAAEEQVQEILWHVGTDGQASTEHALVTFRDHRSAEKLLARKTELPFSAEWCENQALPAASGAPATGTPAPAATREGAAEAGVSANGTAGGTTDGATGAANGADEGGKGDAGAGAAEPELENGEIGEPEATWAVDLSEEEDAGAAP